MKNWTAVSFQNLETKLTEHIKAKGYTLKHIQLPPNVAIQLDIELDDELFDRIKVNPTFIQRLQSTALQQVQKNLDETAALIIQQDSKAHLFPQKISGVFSRDITDRVNRDLNIAGQQMVNEANKMFDDLKRTEKDLTRYRVKAGCKIVLSSVGIAAGVAISVGTGGSVSPLGALGIIRSCIGIAQEVTKLAIACDEVDKLIRADFAVLKKIMSPNLGGASTTSKAFQGTKEIGLNVFSKTVGVETTSLKNLKSRIDLLKINVGKLDKESAKLSENVYGLMDSNKAIENDLKIAKQTLPAPKVGKIDLKLRAAEAELDKLLKNVIKVNEGINRVKQNHPKYEAAYAAMNQGMPGWITKVDFAVGLVMDIGTGIADSSKAIEMGLGTMVTIVTAVSDEFALDPIAEKSVPVV